MTTTTPPQTPQTPATTRSAPRRLADITPWSRPRPVSAEGVDRPAQMRSWTGPVRDLVRDPGHGPLPALLLVLTVATGLIDAVSILGLGRVFVANMTGNVVFLGFALAGAPGFSLAPSLAALAGFLAGALAGGRLVQRWAGHRGLLLRNITALELVLVALATAIAIVIAPVIATGITAVSPADPTAVAAVAVAALLAVAMGLQNTMARRLAVPDLTTTVLTMTLTGIAADARRSPAATTARRALAVLTMFAGALGGALLALHTTLAWALAPAVPALAVVVAVATAASRHPAGWHNHNASPRSPRR
jgi:uncharacterized membrane protein YoaK (UPF0700 family)